MAERIDVQFGVDTLGDPRKSVLDWGNHTIPNGEVEEVPCGFSQITVVPAFLGFTGLLETINRPFINKIK